MTLPPPSNDEARVRAWLEIRTPLERQLAPLGEAAMAALGLAAGARVLDIGCGIGGTPLALARAVGPAGTVVGMDLLQGALDVAQRDADRPANVSYLQGDAQSHPFAPASFDAVFSRFGVMFFADPAAAFANIHRALAHGGRLAFVCWRGLDDNELDALPLRAAAPCLPAALVDDSAAAGWFSFAERESIHAVLTEAGFTDIEMAAHDQQVRCGSLAATVDVCSRVGALGKILRDHPELRRDAVPALERALRPLDGPGGPPLRAATWIVSARSSHEALCARRPSKCA